MSTEKTNSPEYAAVAATLGLKDNYEVKDVMARLNTLVSVEAKLKETEKSLTDAQTVIAGKDATITNLQKDLTTATASLSAYQQKRQPKRKRETSLLSRRLSKPVRLPLNRKRVGWLWPRAIRNWWKGHWLPFRTGNRFRKRLPMIRRISGQRQAH